MTWLSKIRMGAGIGLLAQHDANRVNRLFTLDQLRNRLLVAVAQEDYHQASKLRDQIERLENRVPDPRVFDLESFASDNLDEGDTA